MDRERIRRAALGRKTAAADLNRTMRRRMIAYALGILLIGGFYLFSDKDEAAPTARTQPLELLGVPDLDRAPLAQVDPELLSGVRDATRPERAYLEPEARDHLLTQAGRLVYGDLEKLGLDQGDHEALLQHSAENRGRPVWVLGTLQWMEPVSVDRFAATRGEIMDPHGRSWLFLVLTEPWNVEVGGVVRVSGFFFKLHDGLRPDGGFASGPLLVGGELLPSAWRIDPVTQLRPELALGVRDYDLGQASTPLESPEFYELLSYVNNATEEQLFPPDQAVREVLPAELLTDPAHWRCESVQTTGTLLYMRQAPLGPRGENPLGIPQAWQLWVSDNRAGEAGTMLVYCLEKPEGVNEKDIVDVRGVFFRRWAFETRRKEARMAAVILAREVTRFVPAPDTLSPMIMQIIVWMVMGAVLLLVFGQWRERQSALVARGRRLKRKRKLVGAQLPGSPGGEPPG